MHSSATFIHFTVPYNIILAFQNWIEKNVTFLQPAVDMKIIRVLRRRSSMRENKNVYEMEDIELLLSAAPNLLFTQPITISVAVNIVPVGYYWTGPDITDNFSTVLISIEIHNIIRLIVLPVPKTHKGDTVNFKKLHENLYTAGFFTQKFKGEFFWIFV